MRTRGWMHLGLVAAVVLAMTAAGMAEAMAEGMWTATTMPQAGLGVAGAAAGGKVLFAGAQWGPNEDSWTKSDVVYIYDPNADTWSSSNLSQARTGVAGVGLGNQAFFAGGIVTQDWIGQYGPSDLADVVDIYDAASETWTQGHLSQARTGIAAAAAGGKVLFAGGSLHGTWGTAYVGVDTVDVYDVGSGKWTVTHMGQPRQNGSAVALGGLVYIVSGGTDAIDIYNPADNTWSLSHLPRAPRVPHAAAVGSRILFVDAEPPGDLNVGAADLYHPADNTWTNAALHQAQGVWMSAVGVDNVAFIVAGAVDTYDDSTGTWGVAHLWQPRYGVGVVGASPRAFFAGGSPDSGGLYSPIVDIYTPTTTAPPMVAMVAPTSTVINEQRPVFFANDVVPLVATASTTVAGATLAGVEFYCDTQKVGDGTWDSTSGTWTFGWSPADSSWSLLTAKAVDSLGVSAFSLPVQVITVGPPVVAFDQPGQLVVQGADVDVAVSASEPYEWLSQLVSVELYDGATKIADMCYWYDNWHADWITTGLAFGPHTLTAIATNDRGMTTVATPVVYYVDAPLAVAILSPTDTRIPLGAAVNLTATASTANPEGSVASVQFWDGAALLGPGVYDAASGTWTYAWNTLGAAGGDHNLTAVATDDLGMSATSTPATVVTILIVYPTVAITLPVSTSSATGGGTINVAARAYTTVPGVSMASVRFYDGATLLGPGIYDYASGTWTHAWNTTGAAAGDHNLTAVATDTLGTSATSTPATVVNIVAFFPTVVITSPTSTCTVLRGAMVSLNALAAATLPGATVTGVSFCADGTLNGAATDVGSGNWSFGWNTAGASVGLHYITAVVTDSVSQTGTSLAVVINVAVSLPPAVMITSPKGGLIAGQGWQITLTATTTDGTPGTVTSVEFFDNGTKIAGGNGALSGGVWTYGWDTSAASFAAHSLVAKVTDSGGQTATSAPVLITVRLPADGNGDNIVDGEDYGIWQNGYNHPGATMNTGDYNGDGIVDGEDYGVWQNNYNRTNGLDDVAVAASPADAASLPMGGGAAPRLMAMTPASGAVVSGVTCMALVFDSDVKIGAGAVELSGLATGARSDFVAAYDAAARTLTLTWGRPLPPDVYTVRVVADFVVGAGGGAPLDGEVGNPAAATLPSGDGTPGGDARWTFTAE